MNRALIRMLKKHSLDKENDPRMLSFLDSIQDFLGQAEESRKFFEHALNVSSKELNEINSSLREDKIQLKNIIAKQEALFHASPEAIFSFTLDNIIDKMNQAGKELLLLENISKDDPINLELFLSKIKNKLQFREDIKHLKENDKAILNGIFETYDKKIYEYYSVPELSDDILIGRVWCCRDITESQANQELLKYQAHHDSLTGLPNRMMISEELEKSILISNKNNKKVAVLFIDLDDFKKINDTAGHDEGDRYLIDFSHRLKSCLGENGILGRLGGDEFLVILKNINSTNEIIQQTNKILDICTEEFYINNKQYYVSCSIGISISPDDSIQSSELVRKADMSMYQAKKKGKNQFQFFNQELENDVLNKVILERELRSAIENKEFFLDYQPKTDLRSNDIYGVEALIRWKRTDGSIYYPDKFINLAESTGLIKSITYWLIEEACITLKKWENTVLDNVSLSINISAIDFSDKHFISNAFSIIDKYNINNSLLEFELTESYVFEDILSAKESLKQLKSNNIKVSIDDFGTGFSSFAYLLDIDIDFLKIDKSFIMNIENDNKAKAIVKSIIDIGNNLGLKIVAEGIESNEEMLFLTNEGCDMGQGYYISKPISPEKLVEFAKKMKSKL